MTPNITPIGEVLWSKLDAPDTTYGLPGIYCVKIKLSAADSGLLIDSIAAQTEETFQAALARAATPEKAGDVAAAGGWSDVGTLLRCYQQPDDATMLAVMSHDKRVKQG